MAEQNRYVYSLLNSVITNDALNVQLSSGDATVLYTGTVTTTGGGDALDTKGYASIVVQFTGIWSGKVHCEVSNDGTNWERMPFYSSEEVSFQDAVDQNGLYLIQVTGRYVRAYVAALTGSVVITIIGRTATGARPVDMLSLAMDRKNNTPLQVQLPKDLKQEADGSILIADMKPYVWKTGNTAESLVIDCTGYQSVLVHKLTAGVVTPTVSNDGLNYVASLAAPVSTMVAAATMPTAVNIYVMPVVSKWLKLTSPASSVTCYIYLSQSPFQSIIAVSNQSTNMAQVAGTATVTAGVAGTQAVGGNIAAGTAPTTNPIIGGVIDDNRTGLTRRNLGDVTGRQFIATQSQTGVNEFGFANSYKNILSVQDVSRSDAGFNQVELLQEILLELRTLNIQIHELPRTINEGRASHDEPENIRKDKIIY